MLSLSNCHFCVNVSANQINCGRTKRYFWRKACSFKSWDCRAQNTNQKYDQVLEKLTEQEKARKEIKKENNFLKSTVNTCTWFSKKETNGKFNIRFQGPNIWNTIDKIEAISFSQFKSKLKQHIFRCTNIGNYLVLRNFHPSFLLFLQWYVLVYVWLASRSTYNKRSC